MQRASPSRRAGREEVPDTRLHLTRRWGGGFHPIVLSYKAVRMASSPVAKLLHLASGRVTDGTAPTRLLRLLPAFSLSLIKASRYGRWLRRSTGTAELAHVEIIGTGGTIAGAPPEPHEAGWEHDRIAYVSGRLPIEMVVGDVPDLEALARVTVHQLMQVRGQDIGDAELLKIIRYLREPQNDPRGGRVLLAGTDAIAQLAYFLDLLTDGVVVSGSMRNSTHKKPDGPRNIRDATAVAAHPDSRRYGVLVVENGEIHAARYVMKRDTNRLGAFVSVNGPRMGIVSRGRVRFESPPPRRLDRINPPLEGVQSLPWVEIVSAFTGRDGSIVDQYAQTGIKGLVIEGVGDGNMSRSLLAAVECATSRGIPVIRATHIPEGGVHFGKEIADGRSGTLPAGILDSFKARLLVQLLRLQYPGTDLDSVIARRSLFVSEAHPIDWLQRNEAAEKAEEEGAGGRRWLRWS